MGTSRVGLGGVDCETPSDFDQYYRNRFFALPGEDCLTPTSCIGVDGSSCSLAVINQDMSYTQMMMDWRELRKKGMFGTPFLGNVIYGDSYKYLWNFARRQSVKGISLEGMSQWMPDRYGLFRKMEGLAPLKGNTSYQSNLTVNGIFNPKYFSWIEALDLLGEGKRIGCPIDSKVGLYLAKGCVDVMVSHRFKTVAQLKRGNIVKLLEGFEHLSDILRISIPKNVEIVI